MKHRRNGLRVAGSSHGAPQLVAWSQEHVAIGRRADTFGSAILAFLAAALATFAIVVGPDGQSRVIAIDEYVAELRASGADSELIEAVGQCQSAGVALVVFASSGASVAPVDNPALREAIAKRATGSG